MPPIVLSPSQFQDIVHLSHSARKMETQLEVASRKAHEAKDKADYECHYAEMSQIYQGRLARGEAGKA